MVRGLSPAPNIVIILGLTDNKVFYLVVVETLASLLILLVLMLLWSPLLSILQLVQDLGEDDH